VSGSSIISTEVQGLWRVLDVTRDLSVPVDLDTMLARVINAAREVLGADRGTVYLFDAASNELVIRVATGIADVRFPADRGIAGQCATSRQVLNIPDCYADARFNPEIDRRTGYRTRCMITVPLVGVDDQLVGVMQLLNKLEGVFDANDERLALALAAQCAVALQRSRLMQERDVKLKLERDLSLARDIQRNILPREMPIIAGYDIGGWSHPADQTGGDIFDAFNMTPTRALLLLCDATGHGIGPALSVTQVRSMFRIAARLDADLDAMYGHVNDQLTEDLADNRFVTCFVGQLDAANHTIQYHAGGQGPLLHYHAATGQCTELEASTFPMGIMPGPPPRRPEPIVLAPGDILAVISDGIFEYFNPANEQFGVNRVIDILKDSPSASMQDLIQRIDAACRDFGRGREQGDDMTMVMVRRTL
jgi:phosphoserine phosphatase